MSAKVNRKFFLIFVVSCISSCASGPVLTEIDVSKNPVVQGPRDFQSKIEVMNKFFNSSKTQLPDKELELFSREAFRILKENQISTLDELVRENRLLLRPGHSYEFDLESFCVQTGVERPVQGDGLFLGDIEGSPNSWLLVI